VRELLLDILESRVEKVGRVEDALCLGVLAASHAHSRRCDKGRQVRGVQAQGLVD
jgi:hypothetical protein